MTLTRLLLGLALTTSLVSAQGQLQSGQPQQAPEDEEYEEFVPEPVAPEHAFEVVVGGDGLHLGYRNGLARGRGYGGLDLFFGQDDDWIASGRLMRFGEPAAGEPFGLGVGLGLYAGSADEVNADFGAVTLIGACDYTFTLDYDLRLGLELAYAPDATSFSDAERVLDLLARAEIDLSAWATGFVGYRFTEVDIDDERDQELEQAAHLGVRLGL